MYEYYNLQARARAAELKGDWRGAHVLWVTAGCQDEANACLLIINAVAKGDQFRSLVEEKLQTMGLPPSAKFPPCPTFDKILREVYQEVYP